LATVPGRAGGQEPAKRMQALAARVAADREQALAQLMAHIVERFDQLVFQPDNTPAGARKRLDGLLAVQVDILDRACRLTEAQRNKLHLAGRGDINRFFDQCEGAKRKWQRLEPTDDKIAEVRQDLTDLRSILEHGLFHENSLLYKSLPNTLT